MTALVDQRDLWCLLPVRQDEGNCFRDQSSDRQKSTGPSVLGEGEELPLLVTTPHPQRKATFPMSRDQSGRHCSQVEHVDWMFKKCLDYRKKADLETCR